MVRPEISLGVEQPDRTPGKRVASCQSPGFVAIARGTTQAQIVEVGTAPGTLRDDMVYLTCNPHHLLGAQAVCAPALRGGKDSLPQRLRDTGYASCLHEAQRIVGFRFH
jgi:hypothetical protein